jgi:hypothetical protein
MSERQLPNLEQREILTPEETIEILRDQINELLLAGDAVTKQLRAHGDHQSNFYGHSSDRCATCTTAKGHDDVVSQVTTKLDELFPTNS